MNIITHSRAHKGASCYRVLFLDDALRCFAYFVYCTDVRSRDGVVEVGDLISYNDIVRTHDSDIETIYCLCMVVAYVIFPRFFLAFIRAKS